MRIRDARVAVLPCTIPRHVGSRFPFPRHWRGRGWGRAIEAMPWHRRAFPTPRGGGKRDPQGGLARPPAALPGACDASSITARRAPCRTTTQGRPTYRGIVQVSTRPASASGKRLDAACRPRSAALRVAPGGPPAPSKALRVAQASGEGKRSDANAVQTTAPFLARRCLRSRRPEGAGNATRRAALRGRRRRCPAPASRRAGRGGRPTYRGIVQVSTRASGKRLDAACRPRSAALRVAPGGPPAASKALRVAQAMRGGLLLADRRRPTR